MREPLERLADDLASLRPRSVSSAARRRIARRLSRRRRLGLFAAVAFSAAACLIIAVLAWHSRSTPTHGTPKREGPRIVQPPVPPAHAEPPPTLLAYRLAAGESEAALERLLDRHAARLLPPTNGPDGVASWRHQPEGARRNGT